MFHPSDDKQYLAMLAIPVLLSIVFAIASDSTLNTSLITRDSDETRLEESDESLGGKSALTNNEDLLQRQNSIANIKDALNKRQLLKLAIESRDYEAFLLASVGTPFAEIMTESAFDVLVNEYQLQKSGYIKSTYMDIDSGDSEA